MPVLTPQTHIHPPTAALQLARRSPAISISSQRQDCHTLYLGKTIIHPPLFGRHGQEVLEEYSISLSRSLYPSPLEEPLHSVERERQPHSILRDNTHLYLGNMAGLGIEYLSMPLPIGRGSPFCGENKQPHSIPRDNTHTSIPEKQHHTYIQQRQSSPR